MFKWCFFTPVNRQNFFASNSSVSLYLTILNRLSYTPSTKSERSLFNSFRKLYENGEEKVLHEIGKKVAVYKKGTRIYRKNSDKNSDRASCIQTKKSATSKPKERRVSISSGEIRSVWKRHNLKTFEKRLKALEAEVAQGSIILTEGQLIVLEKAKEQKDAQNVIETKYLRYLGGEYTCYVGYIEGMGKSTSNLR